MPSTAATTTRMGLMLPVDSDLFKASDYNATFSILDAIPGILPVANYAALPVGWTAAQHGTTVLQLDNGAQWYWYQPSGVGQWKRVNSVGLVAQAFQTAAVSTTSQSSPGPSFNTTGNFTAPGVRPLRINIRTDADSSSGVNSIIIFRVHDNGTVIYEYNVRSGQTINGNGTHHDFTTYITNPTPGSTHNITCYFRCANLTSAAGGQGTSVVRRSAITVIEE